jgi:ABC-type lipoprotein release transport system permease subunit
MVTAYASAPERAPVRRHTLRAAVSALLILAAVLASYLPARRGLAIDPAQALQAE